MLKVEQKQIEAEVQNFTILSDEEKETAEKGLRELFITKQIQWGSNSFFDLQIEYFTPIFIMLESINVRIPHDWLININLRKPIICNYSLSKSIAQTRDEGKED